jgi:hypothetical protein
VYAPSDFTPEAFSFEWYVGPWEEGAGAGGEGLALGLGGGVGPGADAAVFSCGALRGPRGGGAGCLGYWRRAAAPAADLAGFEAAEPIEDCRLLEGDRW